jgi:hypothetical protein
LNLAKHLLALENFDGIEVDYPYIFYFEFFWPVAKQPKDCLVIVFGLFENTFDEAFFIRQKKVYYMFGSHKNQVKIKIESYLPKSAIYVNSRIHLAVESVLFFPRRSFDVFG